MSAFFKKTLWPCYATTFLLFALIFLWGISGSLGGGGATYRGFSFHILIPIIVSLGGLVLGFQNAYAKHLYPLFSAGLTFFMFHLLFDSPIFSRTLVISLLLPLCAAFAGLGLGAALRKIRLLRQIALGLFVIAALLMLVHIVHAATFDRIIEYNEISFSSPNLPSEMNGYRIAFITDPHTISEARLLDVVKKLNRQSLDLLLLGGDFATSTAWMRQTIEILAQVETTDGIFGVEGNHDNHIHLFAAMEENGMTPLSNSGLHIREGFFLAGVEDLWNRNPSIAHAIEGAQTDDFILLLSHNPDVSMQEDTSRVNLILSGHTHGGQITFFGIWAPYFSLTRHLTAYGQRFRDGWAESRDGTPVFVSRGLGEYMPRVFARPEVTLLTLHSETLP